MTYYGIYKITNLVNGKMYIGQHKTTNIDDGYMGSGILIQAAVKKYGKENFRKEWIQFCESEDEMNVVEYTIVDDDWISRSDTYNLCRGGSGTAQPDHNKGWFKKGRVVPQSIRDKISKSNKGRKLTEEQRKAQSKRRKGKPCPNKGCHWTVKNRKGRVGYHWWTNGIVNTVAKECPGDGFYIGHVRT